MGLQASTFFSEAERPPHRLHFGGLANVRPSRSLRKLQGLCSLCSAFN